MKAIIKNFLKGALFTAFIMGKTMHAEDPYWKFLKNILETPGRSFSRTAIAAATTLALVTAGVYGSKYWLYKAEDKISGLKWALEIIQKNPEVSIISAIMAAIAFAYTEGPQGTSSSRTTQSQRTEQTGTNTPAKKITAVVPTIYSRHNQ